MNYIIKVLLDPTKQQQDQLERRFSLAHSFFMEARNSLRAYLTRVMKNAEFRAIKERYHAAFLAKDLLAIKKEQKCLKAFLDTYTFNVKSSTHDNGFSRASFNKLLRFGSGFLGGLLTSFNNNSSGILGFDMLGRIGDRLEASAQLIQKAMFAASKLTDFLPDDNERYPVLRHLKYIKYNDFKSIESKNPTSPLAVSTDGILCWGKRGKHSMRIPLVQDETNDDYVELIRCVTEDCRLRKEQKKSKLKTNVCYYRIVREKTKKGWRYWLQAIMNGIPTRQQALRERAADTRAVGMDMGPSTVACSSVDGLLYADLKNRPVIAKNNKKLIKLQRKIDTLTRKLNPDNYNEDGTHKRGVKYTHNSNQQLRKLRNQVSDLSRRTTIYRTQENNAIANKILELGSIIITEPSNATQIAKKAKLSVREDGSCKSRKRWGRTIGECAPCKITEALKRKLSYFDSDIIEVDATSYRASQYDPFIADHVKHELGDRILEINGQPIQRDLWSSFLLQHGVPDDKGKYTRADREGCLADFDTFKQRHDDLVADALANPGTTRKSCFGDWSSIK